MQCRQPHTMLCTPHPQFPGNLATRKASTSHAIHIWYASCFINHSFHMTILNIWAECLQGEETCQDLKVIDVVLDSSSDHCPPSWCGINNPSPASKGCVWINCDLGVTMGNSVWCVRNFNPPRKIRPYLIWKVYERVKIAFLCFGAATFSISSCL